MTNRAARRLSVVMVTPRFEPSVGGVETHVREVGVRLVARGHRVTVATTDPGRPGQGLPREAVVEGIRIVRVPAWPRHSDLLLAPGLSRVVEQLAPDLVHVQSWHTLVAPLALATTLRLGLPTVLTFHSGGHSSRFRRLVRGPQRLLLRPLLQSTDRLVAVSRFEADLLARQLRIRRSRFEVVPNGADLPAPSPRPARDPNAIVSVGRLEAYKGHDRLIRVLPLVRRHRPGAHLRIVGAGPDEARLQALASDLGVAPFVVIGGIAAGDRAALAATLARAGVVVILSAFESQGIAAYEAAGVGAPVLVRRDSALAELVEGGLAAGIDPQAPPPALAEAIVAQLEGAATDPPPRVPAWDDTALALEQLYARVLTERGLTRAEPASLGASS